MCARLCVQWPARPRVRGIVSRDMFAHIGEVKVWLPWDQQRLHYGLPSLIRVRVDRKRYGSRRLKHDYDLQDGTLLQHSARRHKGSYSNDRTSRLGIIPSSQRHHRSHSTRRSLISSISRQNSPPLSSHSHPPSRPFSSSSNRNTTPSSDLTSTLNDPSLLRPLFLASIGNPGRDYATTRHSAGHILLQALATHLSAPPLLKSNANEYAGAHYAYAPLTPDSDPDHDILLWRSPSYMNDSGPALVRSFARFKAAAELGRRQHLQHLQQAQAQSRPEQSPGDQHEKHSTNKHGPDKSKTLNKYGLTAALRDTPLLVVLHDELELDLGRFALRRWGVSRSPRGHNGLKSIRESLLKNTALDANSKEDIMLVGVGIGPRPESREPRAVAGFVLEELGRRAEKAVEGLAPAVWTRVGQMREGRRMGEGDGAAGGAAGAGGGSRGRR